MIKRQIAPAPSAESADPAWLSLDSGVEIEFTSEAPGHPVEAALEPGNRLGWIAASPGAQTLRVRFDPKRIIRRVRVVIEELQRERTQEFVIRAAIDASGFWRELIRQQFTFSPNGATRQLEEYHINLPELSALELTIVPDVHGGDARASLQELRFA